MAGIKGKYPDTESVRKMFKPQASTDTCFPTSILNVISEFLNRERISMKITTKDIRTALFKKGPYGQIAFREYTKKLSELLKGENIRSIETYHQPSLIPFASSGNEVMDIDRLSEVCRNPNCSFPYVTVSGRWFEAMGLDSWADTDNNHVIIVIDVDEGNGAIHFYDPAEKFIARSSRATFIPKLINSDRFFSYWDEHHLPRQTGWFERIQKPLTEW